MSLEKEKKLKQLYQLLPENVVAPSGWLQRVGIRVKRLFLFFADHYNFVWTKYLYTKNLNLGSGKIQIVQNGYQ